MAHALVKIPAKLADAFDTYFQTSRFAQKNFVKFNKDAVLAHIEKVAARYNYVLDASARSPNFKGVFKLANKSRTLRVSASTLPLAEDWK